MNEIKVSDVVIDVIFGGCMALMGYAIGYKVCDDINYKKRIDFVDKCIARNEKKMELFSKTIETITNNN